MVLVVQHKMIRTNVAYKQKKKTEHLEPLFKFYRGKRPAITWGGVWHQCQTPPLTLLRGIIRV